MKKLLAVLLVCGFAVPVMAATDTFPVMIDGNFDTPSLEGYTNRGACPNPRLDKAYQEIGFMSWSGSLGNQSHLSLAQFLAANPGAVNNAVLYLRILRWHVHSEQQGVHRYAAHGQCRPDRGGHGD